MSDSQGETPTETTEYPIPGNWFPENYRNIRATLENNDTPGEPVAVFDFDNTCIYRDIGQAVFRYQLFALRYRLSPEDFLSVLPQDDFLLDGKPLKDVTARLVELYRILWPLIKAGRIEEAQQLPEYPLFTTMLLWFTEKARKDERLGPRYILPLIAKMLAGFSTSELDLLAREVINALEEEPLVTNRISADLGNGLGILETSYECGLKPYEEMRDLIQWLGEQDIRCHVISASPHWLVLTAAGMFDFPVEKEDIFGIKVELEAGEILTTRAKDAYPTTFREGKVEVIKRFIDKEVVLVAGDADTDYDMLTLPSIPVRLIINRNQKGLISSLYQDPRFLLQGIDTAKGCFRPSRTTVGS